MKIRGITKRIVVGVVATVSMILLTGCGESLKSWVSDDLQPELLARVTANREVAQDLYGHGIISETTYNDIIKTLQSQEDYVKSMKNDTGNLTGSVVKTWVYGNGSNYSDETGMFYMDGNEEIFTNTKTNNELDDYVAGNYVRNIRKNLAVGSGLYQGDGCAYESYEDGSTSNVSPFTLVTDDAAREIQERMKFEVWVLNPSYETASSDYGIDSLIALVQAAVTVNNDGEYARYSVDRAQMDKFFIPAVDENGNILHLIDIDDEANQLVKESVPNSDYGSNRIGNDLVVQQNGYNQISVRVKEFNTDFCDRLLSLFGTQSARLVVAVGEDGKENRVYLLEYPISYVSKIEDNGDGTVSPVFEESRLGINLFTGKIVKRDGNSSENSFGTVLDDVDKYYYTVGSKTDTGESTSSFILKGRTTTDVSFSLDADGTMSVTGKAYTGRIILRDYLELAFAPGCSSSVEDNVVAFGRKIRLDFGSNWTEEKYNTNSSEVNSTLKKQLSNWEYSWDKRGVIAYFVDRQGVRMDNSNKAVQSTATLTVQDICDSQAITDDDPVVKTIPELNNQSITISDGKDDITGKAKIDELQHKTGTSITAGIEFPGVDVDKEDYDTDTSSKQWFYGLTVATDLFETGLYGGWINSVNEENSLEAFNSLMADTGMTYTVDANEVAAYVEGNYAYELSQEGVVILDLETVSKIQDDIDTENKEQRNRFIQTTMIVFGWVLIGYSIILMLAWTLDVHADLGIKILEKLTLGHWVAIKDKEDIPYYDASERRYISMGDIVIRCMFIMIIGVLAMTINIYNVVYVLIEIFAGLAEGIEKAIKGIQ